MREAQWTKASLAAYVAGHIDSDGSIGISANGRVARTFRLRVSLYNNCRETLEFIQSHFGGTIHGRAPHPQRMAQRIQYTLVWQARIADALLRDIASYLMTKRDQAALALDFYQRNQRDGFNGHADKTWQNEYRDRMASLNRRHRGPVPGEDL